jgi:hypothetical protein
MQMEKFSEEVYRLIEKIVTRTERINGYEGRIPAIELDLALEDIRRLYDCFLVAGSVTAVSAPPSVIVAEEESVRPEDVVNETEAIQEPLISEPLAEETTDAPDIRQELEVVVEPPLAEVTETPAATVPEKAPAVRIEKQDDAEKPGVKKILAEKLTRGDKRSVHDLIASGKADQSISARLQHNPISNLKSAIGINEKFIFVYELFGGNSQEYARIIDQLNSMPGRGEAIDLMETLRSEFHWDLDNMAFQKLVDMVSRRYS